LLAAGLVVLLVISVRAATSFTEPLPEVEHYGGDTPVDTGAGNQFLFNGSLVELDQGESPLPPTELIEKLSDDCVPTTVTVKPNESGSVLVCHPKGQGQSATAGTLMPSVIWVESDKDGKSSYMKLTPQERIELDSLIPGETDSVGFDIEDLPRGPDMKRWMSFADPSGSYRSVFYGRGSGSIASTLLWFREALPQAGWTVLKDETESSPYIFATSHNQLVMISLTDGCEGLCASVMATPLQVLAK
jgi:hypothetical protein